MEALVRLRELLREQVLAAELLLALVVFVFRVVIALRSRPKSLLPRLLIEAVWQLDEDC